MQKHKNTTKDDQERFLKRSNEKRTFAIECRYNRKFSCPILTEMLLDDEWKIWRKYRTIKDAEMALGTLSKKGNGYEFRIVRGE